METVKRIFNIERDDGPNYYAMDVSEMLYMVKQIFINSPSCIPQFKITEHGVGDVTKEFEFNSDGDLYGHFPKPRQPQQQEFCAEKVSQDAQETRHPIGLKLMVNDPQAWPAILLYAKGIAKKEPFHAATLLLSVADEMQQGLV